MGAIGSSHQVVWGSDYEAIRTEWHLTLNKDYSSFDVGRMMVQTDQLLWIKEAANVKNIYPQEHEADVHWKKTLVQSLKQLHACYY